MAGITVLDGPTIRAGESLSDSIDLVSQQGKAIAGLLIPFDMPMTYITFQLSQGLDDFRDLYSVHGGEVTIYISPGARMVFDTNWSLVSDYLKIRTGTAQFPIVQEQDRVFKTIIATDPAIRADAQPITKGGKR